MERYPQNCPLCESPRYIDPQPTDMVLYDCGSGFALEDIVPVQRNDFTQSKGCAIIRHWKSNHAEAVAKKRAIGKKYGSLLREYIRVQPIVEAAEKIHAWSEEEDPGQLEWGYLWNDLEVATEKATRER